MFKTQLYLRNNAIKYLALLKQSRKTNLIFSFSRVGYVPK